jgi:hypothetical protein
MKTLKRILSGAAALILATAIWLPCLHFVFTKSDSNFRQAAGLSPKAQQLVARHLELWNEPDLRKNELERMRASNAEWDFMGRTFLVWSMANISLRDPQSKQVCLRTMDEIIDEILRLEKEKGMYFFLMDYAKAAPYVMKPGRSLFLDGEIALMLASRRMVEEKLEYKPLLKERVDLMAERLQNSPHFIVESYPDECWMFDHCVALDAMKMADHLDGTDHSKLIHNWITMAKQKLIDRESGLLLSSFTTDDVPLGGPQGSSLWMVSHCLQILDPDFARDQYQRTRKQLGEITLGFGYAHEWPKTWNGPANIDSGPIVPVFNISAGSSGMAFIGASAFEDREFLKSLNATLDFAAFPSRKGGRLKYCASNQVGDAAFLYAATLGPLWQKLEPGAKL